MAKFEIDFLELYDNDSIISELKRIASEVEKDTVTKADIENFGRISYSLVNKRFGSLRKALELADLKPQRYMNASDEELLQIPIKLWEQTIENEGRTPQRRDLRKYNFPVSGDIYWRRFGSWKKALMKAYNSIDTSNLEFETLSSKNSDKSFSLTIGNKERCNTISLRKRFFVMKRDSFSCVLCGASGHGTRLEVDHIIPRSKGGTDALDNLRTLCFECNRGKRDTLE